MLVRDGMLAGVGVGIKTGPVSGFGISGFGLGESTGSLGAIELSVPSIWLSIRLSDTKFPTTIAAPTNPLITVARRIHLAGPLPFVFRSARCLSDSSSLGDIP